MSPVPCVGLSVSRSVRTPEDSHVLLQNDNEWLNLQPFGVVVSGVGRGMGMGILDGAARVQGEGGLGFLRPTRLNGVFECILGSHKCKSVMQRPSRHALAAVWM